MSDHERGVQKLFEPELFGNIKRRAEEARRGHLTIDQKRQAVEQQSAEMKLDLIAPQKPFEPLQCRVMAA